MTSGDIVMTSLHIPISPCKLTPHNPQLPLPLHLLIPASPHPCTANSPHTVTLTPPEPQLSLHPHTANSPHPPTPPLPNLLLPSHHPHMLTLTVLAALLSAGLSNGIKKIIANNVNFSNLALPASPHPSLPPPPLLRLFPTHTPRPLAGMNH